MNTLVRVTLSCFATIIILIAMLIFSGISDQPELKLDWAMTQADINRAKKILREGSKTRPDEIGTIELTLADLNLAGNYLLNRFSKGKVLVALKDHKIRFAVTATLPENVLGKYVNISFRLGNADGNALPTLTKFKAGKLLLPSKVAAFVIEAVIRNTSLNEYFLLAKDPIKAVAIGNEKITITYHPSQATLDTARDLLTHNNASNIDSNAYQSKLIEIVGQHDAAWRLSLAELLKPLFALAYQRSTLTTAIDENRIVINTINDYVNSSKTAANFQPYYPAFLYKRIDLAQHFIGAAAITASVNSQIAQVLGEEKELQDAQGGSGFSFVDLTADKAGTRFGELATVSPSSARKLQQAMAAIKDYTDFMPDPTNLPEHMDEATFKKRYGTINSTAYQKVSKQIDALIAAAPIYRK
ncbi:hypothetical protein [Methyloglobulus sp.]|uniref:hypothetical protein n=1 Tax=Methyloglobulus sp. TaxID=2518622 RepID=UPI0032B7E7BB